MFCSRCYKKIPEGEEVYKSWILTYRGGGAKTVGKFHKNCAIKKDKRIKKLWWLLYGWFALILITGLLVALLLKTEFIRGSCPYCGK